MAEPSDQHHHHHHNHGSGGGRSSRPTGTKMANKEELNLLELITMVSILAVGSSVLLPVSLYPKFSDASTITPSP